MNAWTKRCSLTIRIYTVSCDTKCMHTLHQKCRCTHAYTPMQWCRNFFVMESFANLSCVLREHCAGCRLPPTLLLSWQNQSPNDVRSRNPFKSTLAHDVVATAVSHKHHSIIRVGASLIQFVYGSHSKHGNEAHFIKITFSPFSSSSCH